MKLYAETNLYGYAISPKDVEKQLRSHEGRVVNTKTGWSGTIQITTWGDNQDPDNIGFDIEYIADPGCSSDYTSVSWKNGKVVFVPTHGAPTFCRTMDQVRSAIRDEFSGLVRNK